jgi:hypothetical protein
MAEIITHHDAKNVKTGHETIMRLHPHQTIISFD